MTSPAFRLPLRVYIEDSDAGGIVYYVNYLKFMERARTEWLRTLGYQHYSLAEQDYLFVVHSCAVRYHRPARVDDALEVSAELVRLGKATLDFHQRVWRADELLCEADVRVACVSAGNVRPQAMPAAIYSKLKNSLNR
ncbi:MAG: tol-pal system-associated acyl-CoA thioesterase [Alcanivoracaceae bacterium]|jgi:tol-pal system-associated acyl-CoA thioesterase|nr:tol-pal system-associated acyl-CoA thioesterase [Alcanivoracaceae bacterium]